MPENLANNSANLQPVGMHVMHDVHNYVSDCAVVGVPLRDTDNDTRHARYSLTCHILAYILSASEWIISRFMVLHKCTYYYYV